MDALSLAGGVKSAKSNKRTNFQIKTGSQIINIALQNTGVSAAVVVTIKIPACIPKQRLDLLIKGGKREKLKLVGRNQSTRLIPTFGAHHSSPSHTPIIFIYVFAVKRSQVNATSLEKT